MKIICVKLRQKVARVSHRNSTDVIPYDRLYLIGKKEISTIARSFDYFISFELTQDVLTALNAMLVADKIKTVTVQGMSRDSKDTVLPVPSSVGQSGLDTVIVPTHIYRLKKASPKLGYILSQMVGMYGELFPGKIPELMFHAKERKVETIQCSVCTNVLDMLTGKCHYWSYKCRNHVNILAGEPNGS